jgi:vacuolar-type H+-ATPase subunit I/STV1
MFATIIKEHRLKSQQTRAQLASQKQAILTSVDTFNAEMLNELTRGIGTIYKNQKRLENEAQLLALQTGKFSKNMEKWLSMYHSLNDALKEFGDIENWVESIETDMNAIASSLSTIIAIKQHEKEKRERSSREPEFEPEKPQTISSEQQLQQQQPPPQQQ